MFTIILIVLASLFAVVTVVNEIRVWGKGGRKISLNAPSDDDNVNRARLMQDSNPHKQGPLGGGY